MSKKRKTGTVPNNQPTFSVPAGKPGTLPDDDQIGTLSHGRQEGILRGEGELLADPPCVDLAYGIGGVS
jgi:hypothetical protein